MSEKGKKILIATGLYPPEIGGPATYSKLLEEELPKRAFSVDVLPFSTVRHLPKIARHAAYFFAVLKRGRAADLIYAQDPVSVGFPALCAAKLLRKKFILRVPGDYAWEQGVQRCGITDKLEQFSVSFKGYALTVKLLKIIQKFVASRADAIIVPSYYFKKIISNWGIDSQKIKVIYNGIDLDFEEAEGKGLQRTSSEKVLLSVGRLVPWKGFKELIEMMPELSKKIPDIKLYIAGDGPEREKLNKLLLDLNLEGRVVLLGRVSREKLLEQKQSADVFVFNTHWESFSFDTVECMALGLPVITTNVGPLPELITDKETGVLVEPDNKAQIERAIVDILQNNDFRLKIIQNAKEKAKSFSIDNTVDELEKLFSAHGI